ncbi:acylneuraminate cytidylyltransferase family protein, partial [Campylobacter coli]|nr:acylneuraminate cytidylyltransferase family protein [Campylobacter coli]
MKVSVFLPCRKGSQRVKNKNMRVFGDFQNGLLEIKLKHLIKSQMIDKI